MHLFESYPLGSLTLPNRVVMAPMTRSRAVDQNTPNALMAKYYAQRATAGLIISEATSVSPNGLGYARIPAICADRHVDGWRLITDAVHRQGGRIFLQIFHTGRVAHQSNLPEGARVLAPTDVVCPDQMYTDAAGMQPHTLPNPMTAEDITEVIGEFGAAARRAIAAGFDGIEIHGANGYLLEQFLNANVNTRQDAYGKTPAGRNRLLLEVVQAAADAIGAARVGLRLSPYGVFNGTGAYEGLEEQYSDLTQTLSGLGLAYLHVLDHSAMGAPPVPAEFKAHLRNIFGGTFVLAGGFDKSAAEAALQENRCDLVAFGRPFIANPDLVWRMQHNAPWSEPDQRTFYTPDARGYTDYPDHQS